MIDSKWRLLSLLHFLTGVVLIDRYVSLSQFVIMDSARLSHLRSTIFFCLFKTFLTKKRGLFKFSVGYFMFKGSLDTVSKSCISMVMMDYLASAPNNVENNITSKPVATIHFFRDLLVVLQTLCLQCLCVTVRLHQLSDPVQN